MRGGWNKGLTKKYEGMAGDLAAFLDGGEKTFSQCKRFLGVNANAFSQILYKATFLYPIYEDGRGKRSVLGILKDGPPARLC